MSPVAWLNVCWRTVWRLLPTVQQTFWMLVFFSYTCSQVPQICHYCLGAVKKNIKQYQTTLMTVDKHSLPWLECIEKLVLSHIKLWYKINRFTLSRLILKVIGHKPDCNSLTRTLHSICLGFFFWGGGGSGRLVFIFIDKSHSAHICNDLFNTLPSGSQTSFKLSLNVGIPQGCVLRPLFCTLGICTCHKDHNNIWQSLAFLEQAWNDLSAEL